MSSASIRSYMEAATALVNRAEEKHGPPTGATVREQYMLEALVHAALAIAAAELDIAEGVRHARPAAK
jgi:hypothetical protein